MIKKIFKVFGIVILTIFLLLLILPFFLKGKITTIAKEQINANVNATVDFKDLSVSFIKSFPDVSVDIKDLSVINKAPFDGETLASVKHIYLDMDLASVFGTPMVNHIRIADVDVNVRVNKDSIANYDIAIPSTEVEEEVVEAPTETKFALAIKKYELENINVSYVDDTSVLSAIVKNFNHSGKGDFTQDDINLDTKTSADAITVKMGKIAYLKDLKFTYDAVLGVNLKDNLQVKFDENSVTINDLNIAFDGIFTMLKDEYDINFKFHSLDSKFKSLLSLIPDAYAADFEQIKTEGAINLVGEVNGVYSDKEKTIPTLDLQLNTKNAALQYPDLPKGIRNINLDTHITNTTGKLDDTKVDVKHFGMKIDKDEFIANTVITKIESNPTIKADLAGTLNLDNLSNAYPIDLEHKLHGIVTADFHTALDMNAIDKENYDEIVAKGKLVLEGFTLDSEFTPKTIHIDKADVNFTKEIVQLNEFIFHTGETDVQLKGGLENVYAYVLKDKTLKGRLDITSNKFDVFDLYAPDTTQVTEVAVDTTVVTEQTKIPANIHFITTVKAKNVHYDTYHLTNFNGKMTVKDQKIIFDQSTANMFKGTLGMEGTVDTAPEITTYDFKMDIKQFDIPTAFTEMGMLTKIAPVMQATQGRFDTSMKVKGKLGNDFMPDLNTLTGDAFADLQVDEVDSSKNKFLSLAENNLSFVDFSKTDVEDIKANVEFKDSKVHVKPFTMKLGGNPLTVSGTHSFDQSIDYKLKFDIPAKHLGSSATSLLNKLSPSEQENTKVPLTVNVGGSVTKPTVVPGMKDAVKELSKKAIDSQKKKVKEKAKKEVSKQLNKILGGKSSKGDTKKSNPTDAVKKGLKGLFGR